MAQSIGSVAIRITVIARLIKAIIAGTQIEIAAKLEGLRVMEVVKASSSSCGGISTWDPGSIMSTSKPIGERIVSPELYNFILVSWYFCKVRESNKEIEVDAEPVFGSWSDKCSWATLTPVICSLFFQWERQA